MPEAQLDFYSPFMSAVIVTREDQRFPLWVGAPPGRLGAEGGDDSPYSLAYLQSISVELQLGYVPRITAVLTPPFHEARRIIDSPVIEWGSSILQVQFGYTSGSTGGVVLSPVYEGVILQPSISLGIDTSITINAQGTGGFSSSRQTRGTIYKGTRKQIIEQVAAGPNPSLKRRLEVDFTEVASSVAGAKVGRSIAAAGGGESSPSTSSYELMYSEEVIESQGYLTDWLLLWKIVRECRCTMVLIGNTLVIRPANMFMQAKPKRWLRLYDYPQGRIDVADINGGTLPILSVESPSMHVYLPAQIQGLYMQDVDSATGEDASRLVDDESTKEDRLGQGQAVPEKTDLNPGIDEATGEGAGYFSGAPNNASAVAQAQALFQEGTTGVGIKLNITTLLDPNLFPGDIVAVRGISKRHDGNYAILKANYAIGTSGADMQIECINNAAKLAEVVSGLNQTLPKGPVNSQDPETGDNQSLSVEASLDDGEQSNPTVDALSGGALELPAWRSTLKI